MDRILTAYGTEERVHAALERTKAYWQDKVNARYQTGSADFDRLMRWVSLQPLLRRIYGCSFLPHHDYGRGGRGWRDLWQDCLSLLLMDPGGVGEMIQASFGGVRMDGTNATIIGEGLGNFIADRNGIARPCSTTCAGMGTATSGALPRPARSSETTAPRRPTCGSIPRAGRSSAAWRTGNRPSWP